MIYTVLLLSIFLLCVCEMIRKRNDKKAYVNQDIVLDGSFWFFGMHHGPFVRIKVGNALLITTAIFGLTCGFSYGIF